MAFLPRNPNESNEAWDARMAAAWAARTPEMKHVSELSEAEQREALDAMSRPAPYASPLPADLAALRVDEMTEAQRHKSASLLGIQNYF